MNGLIPPHGTNHRLKLKYLWGLVTMYILIHHLTRGGKYQRIDMDRRGKKMERDKSGFKMDNI